MAFGQSLAALVGDERTVVPGWFRQPERAADQYLSRRGLEQVGSADDLGDGHRSVVDGDRELVGWDSVFAPDEEVAEVFSGNKLLRPKVAIAELDCLRHPGRGSAS